MSTNYFREIPQSSRQYKAFITAEDKDYIMDELLLRANNTKREATLKYKDIEKQLNISKGQFDSILTEFKEKGLISRTGYSDTVTLLSSIELKKEMGGFKKEREAFFNSMEELELRLEKLQGEANPSAIDKINNMISKAKNITDLVTIIKDIKSIF